MGIIRSKIILKYKMLNLDDIVSNKKENKDTTGSSSSERNDWAFRMLIIEHQVLVKQTLYYI